MHVTLNSAQKVVDITKGMGLPVKLPKVTFRHQLKAQKIFMEGPGGRTHKVISRLEDGITVQCSSARCQTLLSDIICWFWVLESQMRARQGYESAE